MTFLKFHHFFIIFFFYFQFYDFIEEIGSKNITFYYSKNNKDKLLYNIESRINKYSTWKNTNANELNEWLNNKRIDYVY